MAVKTIEELLKSAREVLTDKTYANKLAGDEKAKYETLIHDAVDVHLKAALQSEYKGKGAEYGISTASAVLLAQKIAAAIDTSSGPWDGKVAIKKDADPIYPIQFIHTEIEASATKAFDEALGSVDEKNSARGVANSMGDQATIDRLVRAFDQREKFMQGHSVPPSQIVDLIAEHTAALQKYAGIVGIIAGAYETTTRAENVRSMQEEATAIIGSLQRVINARIKLTEQEEKYKAATNKEGLSLPTKEVLDAQKKEEEKIAERYKIVTQRGDEHWKSPFKNETGKPAKDAFDYAIASAAQGALNAKQLEAISQTRTLGPVSQIASTSPEEKYAGMSSVFDPTKNMGIGGKGSKSGLSGNTQLLSGANAGLAAAAIVGAGLLASGFKKGNGHGGVNPQTGQPQEKKGSVFARVTKITIGFAASALAISAMYRGQEVSGLMNKLNAGVKGVPLIGR